MKIISNSLILVLSIMLLFSCKQNTQQEEVVNKSEQEFDSQYEVVIEAEDYNDASVTVNKKSMNGSTYIEIPETGWLAFDVNIERTGRYQTQVVGSSIDGNSTVWIEDYYINPDERTYNITGALSFERNDDFTTSSVDGSPLRDTLHKMKLHTSDAMNVDKIVFRLIRDHEITPQTLTQNMEGDEWELVWSDEFDGNSVDESKWTYDVGNWGWGNNELQYYTVAREENARIEDGHLVIEARKNDDGYPWTSTRLTTRGKVSFLYGKIEFKARVPRERGNWAAGWTLGDTYKDELSWPYCGEIDILESVGYEVNDETGDGRAHCTVHTPAYYFKINNQISSTIDVQNIAGEFHTYAVEWTPSEVRGYVDGQHYYTYDKNANSKEWPFNIPQNIILNLAMGGGWGGAQGMDETVTSQKYILDYVRVYQLN